MDTAQAAAELRLAEEEHSAPEPLVGEASSMPEFISAVLARASWSVLEAVDAIAARAMAEGESVPVPALAGSPDGDRTGRGLHGHTGLARRSFAIDDYTIRAAVAARRHHPD